MGQCRVVHVEPPGSGMGRGVLGRAGNLEAEAQVAFLRQGFCPQALTEPNQGILIKHKKSHQHFNHPLPL